MSYIVEYISLSGKRIPVLHKIFETAEAAKQFGTNGVKNGNYRSYTVTEAAEKKYRVTAKSMDDDSTFKGGLKSKAAADAEAEKLRKAKNKRGGKSFDNVKVVAESALDEGIKDTFKNLKKHAANLGDKFVQGALHGATYGMMGYNTTDPLTSDAYDKVKPFSNRLKKKNKKTNEGYKELPNIDTDRYGERAGLEGPFQTMAGKVVYYDPQEGSYYDPDTDRYMTYDEFKALDNDYTGMKDERDIPVKEAKGLASIDWPDADKYGSEMAKHAENAIRHGMHAYDAYSHVYSMTLERDWMQAHKDELIKMFASYGLATESIKESLTLDYSRYMRSHGKKPRITGPGLFMFTTKDMGEPGEDDVFQYQGSWADAKRAAAKWAKEKGAYRFYMMENDDDDRDELTKKLFPRKSREEMEKADRERNRAYNQKRFMKPGKPSRSREWGAYESVSEAVNSSAVPFDQEYKSLIKRFQNEIDWDSASVEKDGASTSVIAEKNGTRYYINFVHPEKQRKLLITGWWFVDVSVGSMYAEKRYFSKTGEEIGQKLSRGRRPIDWLKIYKEMVADGSIEQNISEAEKALQKLKSHLSNQTGLDEAAVKFNGKTFSSYKRFSSEAKANAFLEKNDAYGVIGEKDGYVYVAKKSNLGENKAVNEDISQDAHHMERDHEVQMARSDLYKTANYAIKLHGILKGISEEQGLEGWMQAKITKAADYLSSVFHALEYDQIEQAPGDLAMPTEDVNETTSAGGIAAVAQPMGKVIKRKKK